MKSAKFNIGDTVRLRATTAVSDQSATKQRAKVVRYMIDIEGGVVLEPALGGFHYWNVKDLAVVRRVKPPARSKNQHRAS